ncbi:hypothetical protein BO70DRAFT_407555 [Aspergillus heteromorphus CBS 117.55]|uniref:Zn(2)-C6 fungal-type domain-containing protein n=1 Tax=Aspergillus heteromorphus CBS 117.55 TaxID=1448321 RepID=A0A317VXI4_9EURO|nr:uncharacterized protein BO70DRAFT_407555 [Aspergillus heteromorphus CBS 117.55]PWY79146.1 hypothetical protein BO70DRAFT_407555 [Aspergillus heteromorphus CBS 117.55]
MDGRGPYGLACMNCFVAKSKCVGRPEGGGCQRCHRLQKQCYPSDSVRRRKAQNNTTSNARIAQLESRLDSLASIIGTLPPSPITTAIQQTLHSDDPRASRAHLEHVLSSASSSSVPTPPSPKSPQASPRPPAPSNGWSHPSPPEVAAALAIFRSQMLRFCPFIEFSPHVTALQLQRERPFLVEAIVAVTTRSIEEKRTRARNLKTRLGQTMVVENRSSIDLLLAILTYVAWGDDQVIHRSSTLSRLVQLAMSIVYDTRLTKPVPRELHMLTSVGVQSMGYNDDCESAIERSLEVERATLACFLISSFVASYFAQIDALRWTPQLEQNLCSVEANTQCPADSVLAFQVRLQLVAQKAVQVRDQHETDLPIAFCTKALSAQVRDLQDSMPPHLLTNGKYHIILTQLHYVDLSIHETAFTANSDPVLQVSPRPGGPSTAPGWERLGCLWHSVEAIRAWFEVFYRISPAEYLGFTIMMWSQLNRSIVTLYRLSTRVDPAWDRGAVSKTIDVLEVIDRVGDRLEQVSRTVDNPVADDIWLQIGRLGRAVRAWVRMQMGREEPASWPTETTLGSSDSFMGDIDATLLQSIDFGNENWLETLVGWSPGRFS